jgi:hypothetical protein
VAGSIRSTEKSNDLIGFIDETTEGRGRKVGNVTGVLKNDQTLSEK